MHHNQQPPPQFQTARTRTFCALVGDGGVFAVHMLRCMHAPPFLLCASGGFVVEFARNSAHASAEHNACLMPALLRLRAVVVVAVGRYCLFMFYASIRRNNNNMIIHGMLQQSAVSRNVARGREHHTARDGERVPTNPLCYRAFYVVKTKKNHSNRRVETDKLTNYMDTKSTRDRDDDGTI